MFLLMVPVHNLNSGFFFLIYMPGNRNMDLKLNGIFFCHITWQRHVVDGIGGTVKRAVWRHVRSGHVHVSNPEEYAAVAQQRNPDICIEFVSSLALKKCILFWMQNWKV